MKLLSFRNPPQICDDQICRRQELKELLKAIEEARQLLGHLEDIYFAKKREYHLCDRQRAKVDGRLKIIKPKQDPKTRVRKVKNESLSSLAAKVSALPKDKLAELIAVLEGN